MPKFWKRRICATALLAIFAPLVFSGCSTNTQPSAAAASGSSARQTITKRKGFLGAFFRPAGTVPFGVFSVYSKQRAPAPYPSETKKLFGVHGYCDAVSANGLSISSGYQVDESKIAHVVDLNVKWTRTGPSPFFDDVSHLYTTGKYQFGDFDSAQCALTRHHITPMVALEAGPVLYNEAPGGFSPKSAAHYKTPGEFGQWCSAIVHHELQTFTDVHWYSLPGNEVNSDLKLFPGGHSEIAAYSKACYHAVKRADPKSTVYGFELNMDTHAEAPGFVKRLRLAGCGVGTCYDGLSVHMSLSYPIPAPSTPCLPAFGGSYGVRCLEDMRSAANAPIHLLVGETVYTVPGAVKNEDIKGQAIVAEMETLAGLQYVDGVNYANIDECDLYPSGYFSGGCLVDSTGTELPGYSALRSLAHSEY